MAQIQKPDHLKIPLQDITLATNNFSEDNFIGKGGFGSVYKGGQLPHAASSSKGDLTSHTIAVKRLDKTITGQTQREFVLEIIVLASYKHINLSSLVGFSDDDDNQKLLVYKYEINGSLDKHVASTDLTWEQRLQICLGAALGLEYLHGGGSGVLHRNIKSSNILIDANWDAKISDFGLSKICTMNDQLDALIDGYVDPQFQNTGVLTKASDVYSFGVVLFEVLCGRLAVMSEYQDHDERKFLWKFVKYCYKSEKLDETIIMAGLREQMKPYSLQVFTKTAYHCLNEDRKQRPSMKSIVKELQTSFEYQIGTPTRLWGSSTGGSPWSLLLDDNLKLKKIRIDHEDWIFSIGFTVEDLSGSLISSQHGGAGGPSHGLFSEIDFNPEEEIIGILGSVGKTTGCYDGYEVISSLCIVTNERRHGPFGEETETRFSVPWDVGSFTGFYGRSGFYLDGLGFYSNISII